ncbi:MAG: hypothetical protein ABR976_07955 [Terracidiphilus sp.]|jgi:hypothetical protein
MLLQVGQNRQTAAILILIMIACSIFITLCGLAFVHDPRRIRLVEVALALQIPYVSSPLLVYKLICGAGLYTVLCLEPVDDLAILFGHIGIRFQFGGYSSLAFWEHDPVAIGVNWVPLLLFLMVRKSMRVASSPLLPAGLEQSALNDAPKPPSELL